MEPGQRPSPPSSEPSVKYNAKDETVVIGEFDRRKVYKTKPKKNIFQIVGKYLSQAMKSLWQRLVGHPKTELSIPGKLQETELNKYTGMMLKAAFEKDYDSMVAAEQLLRAQLYGEKGDFGPDEVFDHFKDWAELAKTTQEAKKIRRAFISKSSDLYRVNAAIEQLCGEKREFGNEQYQFLGTYNRLLRCLLETLLDNAEIDEIRSANNDNWRAPQQIRQSSCYQELLSTVRTIQPD